MATVGIAISAIVLLPCLIGLFGAPGLASALLASSPAIFWGVTAAASCVLRASITAIVAGEIKEKKGKSIDLESYSKTYAEDLSAFAKTMEVVAKQNTKGVGRK